MNIFKGQFDEMEDKNNTVNRNTHDNYCKYHSAHDVQIKRVEEDIYKITNTIDRFRNNILIMLINTIIQVFIVLMQFIITAKDKL